jgi:hypothetical protein
VSEPSDVPTGITLTADGRRTFLDYRVLPEGPLRTQMRDATLPLFVDRGGDLKSPGSGRMYLQAARLAAERLSQAEGGSEPLDVATLAAERVHAVLFAGVTSPVPVRIVLARKLLLLAATAAGNDTLARYLSGLTLFGYARASTPYTSAELDIVLGWCKSQLGPMFERRNAALACLGLQAEATDGDARARAAGLLADHPLPTSECSEDEEFAWWVAWVLMHGFEEPEAMASGARKRALDALFPDVTAALAATLLVINEYGVEGQVLASMDVGDVRRLPGNSSVMEITGVKSRADRAVSRRGNAVSTWSGGRVLERWIELTAPARRWTGTEHLWLWRSRARDGRTSSKTVRLPVLTYVPDRPLVQEGHTGLEGPGGSRLRLSTRRMRKTWAVRSERALGPGVAGPLDPNHSRLTAWSMYRSVALSLDERRAVIAEAQDDLLGMVQASQVVIGADVTPGEAVSLLVERGVSPAAANRIVRGDGDDSGTVFCKDPHDAPDQSPGSLCRQTPFACLLCRNAVHTRAHLPVILALAETIAAERSSLPAEAFVNQWGGVDLGVAHVLSRFSEHAKAEAAIEIDAARERLKRLGEVYG